MCHLIRKLGLLAIALAMLAGCVSSNVRGQRLVATDKQIEKVGVYIQAGKFTRANTASAIGNKEVDSLFPHLVRRVPMIFSLNGIESKAVLDISPKVVIPDDLGGFQEILRIAPQSISWNSRSGSSLAIGVEMLSRGNNGLVIWRGTITLSTMGFGKFDEALADEFSRKLLAQLRDDGLVKLSGNEVRMPAEQPERAKAPPSPQVGLDAQAQSSTH